MTIVRCPRCRDEVTVPGGAPGKALVRCPLCEEQYLLSEALVQMPPALVVVGGEEAVVDAALTAETGDRLSADEYRLASSAGVFDTNATAPVPAVATRPGTRSTLRPRRKEKSAAGEIIQVILGGLAAVPLALLVLWWGFGRDDFYMGPKVARFAPWIVPAKFRGAMRDEAVPIAASTPSASGPSPETTSSQPQTRKKTRATPIIDTEPASGVSKQLQDLPPLELPPPRALDSGLEDAGQPPQRSIAPTGELTIDNPLDITSPSTAKARVDAAGETEEPTTTGGALGGAGNPPPPMPDLLDLLPDDPPAPQSP